MLPLVLYKRLPVKGDIHVFPNTGREHETDGAPCWCVPSVDQGLIIHRLVN